jgi:hypothetical protein
MKREFRDLFLDRWDRFFRGTEPPITFQYADDSRGAERCVEPDRHRCILADLNRVRHGKALAFDTDSVGCVGGRRYLGYSQEIMPNFEYFLSCGIPGELEGERYKKGPEIVRKLMETMPAFIAPRRWIVFKRWDILEEEDDPEVVIFFAPPDALAGLFTLAGFDETEHEAVVAPFSSGCAAIVMRPYLQRAAARPRAVLGLFDPSARPFVAPDVLTFAVPMEKFERMVEEMDQSFLITETWKRMAERLGKRGEGGGVEPRV